ncbi:MAG: DNA-methyltransferase [Spirochaetaceae bacterium]
MTTKQEIRFGSAAASMRQLPDDSVDLVLTSPPYPMIEMWDESFAASAPEVAGALERGEGDTAFALMHEILDDVWRECRRVLRPGGFLCVNIGDATRTLDGNFRLYSNQARISRFCESLGFQSLPPVIWRKQTNAPNKFMGSGMLPSGAYVTLEHEYILILRRGAKRSFTAEEAARRRKSAFFWEERNAWFSDVWDFKGARQVLPGNEERARSGAFPLELAHRVVNMYSLQGDLVLDPFLGTGTTAAACLLNARSSLGMERAGRLASVIEETLVRAAETANRLVAERIAAHRAFIRDYEERRGTLPAHTNEPHGFPVVTSQETRLVLPALERLSRVDGRDRPETMVFEATHSPAPQDAASRSPEIHGVTTKETEQLSLFLQEERKTSKMKPDHP